MQDPNDLKWARVGTVNHKVVWELVNGPKSDWTGGQVLADPSAERRSRKERARLMDGHFHPVCSLGVVARDVGPDLNQTGGCFRREPVAGYHRLF